MARGRRPVHFATDPLDDQEQPRVEPMNATAGEQWEFDGISEDGTQAFVFGVYRDPNYSFLGTGNLRAYAELAFADGSRYAVVDYAEEATVVSCPGRGTYGTWRGPDFVYTFEVVANMSLVKVVLDNPEMSATFIMTSLAPPRYADNNIWPSSNASTLTVPHFHWFEPVPVADVALDAVIKGKPVAWTGMGGHERLWGAFNWPTCLANLVAVRFRAGPYALSFIEFGSDRYRGVQVPSVLLAENGKKVVGTRRMTVSDDEDYAIVRKRYDGDGVTTPFLADKVTGLDIVVAAPSRGLRWVFTIKHKNVGFEYVLTEGAGGTAYSGTVHGGLDITGATGWEGPAFVEIMKFPEKSWFLARNYVE